MSPISISRNGCNNLVSTMERKMSEQRPVGFKEEVAEENKMENTYFDILDQDYNNMYQYKSELISFGYKKIIIGKMNDP